VEKAAYICGTIYRWERNEGKVTTSFLSSSAEEKKGVEMGRITLIRSDVRVAGEAFL